jgi:hypothetical protein
MVSVYNIYKTTRKKRGSGGGKCESFVFAFANQAAAGRGKKLDPR